MRRHRIGHKKQNLVLIHNSHLLPALHDLILAEEDYADGHWDDEKLSQWWPSLIMLLEHRQEIGRKLHTLRFIGRWTDAPLPKVNRYMEEEYMERARQLVDELRDERVWLR